MRKKDQVYTLDHEILYGDKMYIDFLSEIRQKPNRISDMPERAQDVLKLFQVTDFSSGVPIVEILTKLGFKIFQSDLKPEGLAAYIAVDAELKKVYGSNKIACVHIDDDAGHKKFALAHELGHYIFDYNDAKDYRYYNAYFPQKDEKNSKEGRVNKFASNLLMPEDEFRKKFEMYKQLQSKVDIVNSLEQYFVVSSAAVLRRFYELGITEFENNTEIEKIG